MKKEYRSWLDKWSSRRKEHEKAFKALARSWKKGDLDRRIQALGEEWSERVDCTQCGACCRSPGPRLLDRDILRLSRETGQKKNAFINTHLRRDDEGDYVFQTLPCPFWDKQGLCLYYDARPGACRDYPHLHQKNQRGRLTPLCLDARVCPIVCRTLLDLLESGG